ncbi:MAG: hypothetical protein M9932_01845 [Xanthobacteraceae bacterium]|nr:hypothetical protein [Xanthobacteraceae bacterium]
MKQTRQKRKNPAGQGGASQKCARWNRTLISKYMANGSLTRRAVYIGRNYIGDIIEAKPSVHIAITADGTPIGAFPKRELASAALGIGGAA